MQIFETQAQHSILWSLSHTLLFLISYGLLFIFKWTSTPHIIGSLVQVKAGLWTSIKFFLKHTYCPQEQVCIVSRFSHRFASWWLLRKGHILHKESKPIDPVIIFWEYKSDFMHPWTFFQETAFWWEQNMDTVLRNSVMSNHFFLDYSIFNLVFTLSAQIWCTNVTK